MRVADGCLRKINGFEHSLENILQKKGEPFFIFILFSWARRINSYFVFSLRQSSAYKAKKSFVFSVQCSPSFDCSLALKRAADYITIRQHSFPFYQKNKSFAPKNHPKGKLQSSLVAIAKQPLKFRAFFSLIKSESTKITTRIIIRCN